MRSFEIIRDQDVTKLDFIRCICRGRKCAESLPTRLGCGFRRARWALPDGRGSDCASPDEQGGAHLNAMGSLTRLNGETGGTQRPGDRRGLRFSHDKYSERSRSFFDRCFWRFGTHPSLRAGGSSAFEPLPKVILSGLRAPTTTQTLERRNTYGI